MPPLLGCTWRSEVGIKKREGGEEGQKEVRVGKRKMGGGEEGRRERRREEGGKEGREEGGGRREGRRGGRREGWKVGAGGRGKEAVAQGCCTVLRTHECRSRRYLHANGL